MLSQALIAALSASLAAAQQVGTQKTEVCFLLLILKGKISH